MSGIKVLNLGKDVPPEVLVEAAVGEKADVIGVSSLMTVCFPAINEIRQLAQKKAIHPRDVPLPLLVIFFCFFNNNACLFRGKAGNKSSV